MTEDEWKAFERRLDREGEALLERQRQLRAEQERRQERIEKAWDPDRYVSPDAFANMAWLCALGFVVFFALNLWMLWLRLLPLQIIFVVLAVLCAALANYSHREAKRLRALQSR
jgi:Flp pilus assembly protein TadB